MEFVNAAPSVERKMAWDHTPVKHQWYIHLSWHYRTESWALAVDSPVYLANDMHLPIIMNRARHKYQATKRLCVAFGRRKTPSPLDRLGQKQDEAIDQLHDSLRLAFGTAIHVLCDPFRNWDLHLPDGRASTQWSLTLAEPKWLIPEQQPSVFSLPNIQR